MVDIKHDWDEEDYVKSIDDAFDEYQKACYGEQQLSKRQIQEIKQAFLSGIHWLATRDSYCPDDLDVALRTIIARFNLFFKQ